MARRRSRATTRTFVRGGRQKRIFIPQPVERPVRLHARDVLKGEVISPPVDWFTLHLRGPRREQVGLDQLEARAVPHEKVRGTLPERIMFKYLTDVLHWVEGVHFSFQCLAGHHRTLTADLRWVPISSLRAGDQLLAFDENYGQGKSRQLQRCYATSTVLHNSPSTEKTMKVTLKSGKEIITTPEHPWLVLGDGRGGKKGQLIKGNNHVWASTSELRAGIQVPVFLPTWDTRDDYEAGYLAGFFDGEGSLIQTLQARPSHPKDYYMSVTACQNKGPVLDRFVQMVERAGFEFSLYDCEGNYSRAYDR